MKNILAIFIFAFSTISAFAQSESVKPTLGVTIEREVSFATINNKDYSYIIVELKAAELSYFAEGVRVIVRDSSGKRIYRKRFPKSYLYAFSDGTIQIGKGNALTQLSLYKSNGRWLMNLKEKGIY